MKIIVGITQEPTKFQNYIFQRYGEAGSLTEIGPFLSKLEAVNWLVYIKCMIGNIEEIIPELQSGQDTNWYGFTFERKAES